MSLLRLQLRRIAGERLAALAIVGLVFVTALCLALGPRLLERLADEALTAELQSAPSPERNIIVSEPSRRTGRSLDSLDKVQAAAAEVEQQLPAEVSALVADRRFVVESTSWEVLSGVQFKSLLFLRVQDGIDQHVEIVAGRAPTGFVAVGPDPRPGSLPDQRANVYEMMLNEKTAQEMGVTVDQQLPMALSYVDPRNVGVNLAAGVHVVGIYRVADANDPFWLNDPLVAGFRFHPVGTNTVYVESDAIMAPNAYAAMQRAATQARLPLVYQWRFYLDMARLDANRVAEVMTALRRLQSSPPHSGVTDVALDTSVRSGLLRLMLGHEATWRSATALLAVVGIGALFVAVTCLTLVATLGSNGRRRTAALLLARGASAWRLRLALAIEAMLLALPAAAVALGLAIAVVPDAAIGVTLAAGIIVAAATVVLLTAIGAPVTRSPLARLVGRDWTSLTGLRSSPRRLVIEGALVVGAVAGAVVMRDRGLAAANAVGAAGPAGSDSIGGADPIMIAVPALLGLAAGIVALRAYPLVLGVAARVAAWRRGLVLPLATRRAARGRTSAAVLLTLVATASVAGFAAAAYTALDRAAQAGGWQQVGAPFLVLARDGDLAAFDASSIGGVRGVAGASELATNLGGESATLIALQTGDYQQMTTGTPADRAIPAELTSSAAPADGVLAALVSSSTRLQPGAQGGVTIGADSVSFRVVAVIDAFPLAAADEPFVLVSRDQLVAVVPGLQRPVGAVFVDAGASAGPGLAAAVQADPNLRLLSQADVAANIAATPVARAVSLGLAAAAIAAAAYAALAVVAALVLSAVDQRIETAYLRVLGLTRVQRLRLIFTEHVPAAIVAGATGAVLGAGLFVFVRPGLGLPTIMPRSADVALALDPQQVLALLIAALLIVIPAWALAAFAQREPDPAAAVREGSA